MENYFIKFIAVAGKEKLSEEDKALWRSFVLCAGQNSLQPILAALEERPEMLLVLTGNLRRKIDIMKRGDGAAWAALVKEEEMFFPS